MGTDVQIGLLGGFSIAVDGRTIDASAFERRSGAELVQLLAIADRRSMHREQVMDALWPEADIKAATNRLHKAATFARNGLGRPKAVVIRGELVSLLPDEEVGVDVDVVTRALQSDAASVDAAIAAYRGDLLPEAPYAEWAVRARDRVRATYLNLLDGAGRWDDLLSIDPWHERANLAMMQRSLERGDRQDVLRRFSELDVHLRDELGLVPSPAAVALRDLALQEDGASDAPMSGMRTFVLTDVTGKKADDSVTTRGEELVIGAVEDARGSVFRRSDDGVFAVFVTATHAVSAAVEIQKALQQADWTDSERPQARIGIDVGEAEQRSGDWHGSVLDRTAGIATSGTGDQILCSGLVAELVGSSSMDGIRTENLGLFELPDLAPTALHRVSAEGLIDRRTVPRAGRLTGRPLGPVRERLFGRDGEVSDVSDLILENPLVTVVGAGGAGKTHLARHVGSRLREQFPGGVFFCEFGAVDDAGGAQQEMLTALGAQHQTDATVTESIMRALGASQVLLVLDNCEHLIEPISTLCREVSDRCPGTRLLATSREPLRVTGEVHFRLGELTRPAALELFCAEAATNGVTLEATDPVIDRICERLDDLPMAVRLAAARTRSLSPDDIESLLADRFEFLESAESDGLDHHETLGATIAWSFDALDPDLQTTLSDLAVFANRFSLEAALAVAMREESSRLALVNRIDELRQRSLLAGGIGPSGEHEYRLLESVRLFAGQRAKDDHATLSHLDYFRRRAEQAKGDICLGHDEGFTWFRESWSDVRHAHATAARLDRFDDVVGLIVACGYYCNMFLQFELVGWCEASLDPDPESIVSPEHAIALATWSALASHRSDMELAASLADKALSAFPDLPDAMYARAWIPWSVADLDGCEEWLEKILASPDTELPIEAGSLVLHSILTWAKGGDLEPLTRRLEAIAVGRGDIVRLQALISRAIVMVAVDWDEGLRLLDEAQTIADTFGLDVFSATCRTLRSLGASIHASPEEALEAYIEHLSWTSARGLWAFALAALGTAALLLEQEGRVDNAVRLLAARAKHGFTAGFTALIAAGVLERARELHPDHYDEWHRHGERLDKAQTTVLGLQSLREALAARTSA